MDFIVSSKAKRFSIILVLIGIVGTILGLMFATSQGQPDFQTRLFGNLLTNAYFFFAISLLAFFFLTLQYATETGWYASVKRIIEGVAGYLPYGIGILGIVLMSITFLKGAGVYKWMDVNQHDALIANKTAYLNVFFFWIRTLAYFGVYLLFWFGFKNRSLKEDEVGGSEIHFKNYKKAAGFLVCFAVFSSTSSWDWLMSIDAHWFSTLYGWYVFAGMWCSAMTTLVLLVLYLKKQGYLSKVNESHIHDLGKWTFATSFLWSYMWFSQFMLIWYANIPEEVTYHKMRVDHYTLQYFGMFIVNFAFPMLLLMSRDAKRHYGVLTVVGLLILGGHWMDVYLMVTGGSLGSKSKFGILELFMPLIFAGFFVRVILTNLSKAPLMPVNHPFLDESLHHEI